MQIVVIMGFALAFHLGIQEQILSIKSPHLWLIQIVLLEWNSHKYFKTEKERKHSSIPHHYRVLSFGEIPTELQANSKILESNFCAIVRIKI